jgi:hypothetical protein
VQSTPAPRAAAGVQSIIGFFRDAGIKAKVTKDGRLSVNGVICDGFRPERVPGAGTRRWRQEVDAIAWRCASERLETAIRNRAALDSRREVMLAAVPDEHGFAIVIDGKTAVLVRSTRAVLPDGADINGSFLMGGFHWARLSRALDRIGHKPLEDARRLPVPVNSRAGLYRQPPKLVDSRPERQSQREESLQQQREAWERRQREEERLRRLRQAQVAKGAASKPAAGQGAEQKGQPQGSGERALDSPLSPGAEGLLGFFRQAGISASVAGPGGRLLLNGRETGRLLRREDAPRPWSPDWRDAVDRLAWVHADDVLRRAVKDNAQLATGDRVTAVADENGFAITRDGKLLAVIMATRCSHPGSGAGPLIGNFLTGGSHWDEVTRYLEPVAATAPPASGRGLLTKRIDNLPAGLPRALLDACAEACRRIRDERRVAFERPVVLASIRGELTVQPVIGVPSALSVPFTYQPSRRPAADPLRGRLLLGQRDPMPVIVEENVNEDDAHKAWITMILGFADLTCNSPEPTSPHHLGHQREPASREYRPRRNGPADPVLSRRSWAGPLEPAGQWTAQGGSYVAAHARHLREDQQHSPEAAERAFQVGIVLKPHETWVREYIRGVPEETEIRFRWNAPSELTSYL